MWERLLFWRDSGWIYTYRKGRGYLLVRVLKDVFFDSDDHLVGFAAIQNKRGLKKMKGVNYTGVKENDICCLEPRLVTGISFESVL